MTIEEVLKTLKPVGYIPAEDTVKKEKLYVFQFPRSVPMSSVKPMAEAIQKFIPNVVFIPDEVRFLDREQFRKFINTYLVGEEDDDRK